MRIVFLLCLPHAAADTLLEGPCDVARARVLATNGPSGPVQFIFCDIERTRSYRLVGLICDRAFPVPLCTFSGQAAYPGLCVNLFAAQPSAH